MPDVKPIPDGYHSVTPYLVVDGAAAAIEFYTKAFGAKELIRMGGPGGTVGHAELQIGDSLDHARRRVPRDGRARPEGARRHPVAIHLYVEDVDAVFNAAIAAGAKALPAPSRTSSTATAAARSRTPSATAGRRHPQGGPVARGDGEAVREGHKHRLSAGSR